MSCRWHSPPSSQTGQSCGWLIISHSTTLARNSRASGSSIEMRVPSAAGVMQAMTMLPCLSFSSWNCLTAHCRQAPTDPSAGCQQKYGRLKPSERQACEQVHPVVHVMRPVVDEDASPSSVSTDSGVRGCAARNRRGNISARSAAAPPRRARARRRLAGPEKRACRLQPLQIAGLPCPLFESPAARRRPTAGPPGRACTSRTIPARRTARGCAPCRPGRSGRRATIIVPVPRRLPAFCDRRRNPSRTSR